MFFFKKLTNFFLIDEFIGQNLTAFRFMLFHLFLKTFMSYHLKLLYNISQCDPYFYIKLEKDADVTQSSFAVERKIITSETSYQTPPQFYIEKLILRISRSILNYTMRKCQSQKWILCTFTDKRNTTKQIDQWCEIILNLKRRS